MDDLGGLFQPYESMIPAGGIQLTLVMLGWSSWAVEWERVGGLGDLREGTFSAHIKIVCPPFPTSPPPHLARELQGQNKETVVG